MSSTVASVRKSSKIRTRPVSEPVTLAPKTLAELRNILKPGSPHRPPFRPMGANHAATDCNRSSAGSVIDMTAFNQILNINSESEQVTVQAGVTLIALSRALAKCGLELDAGHDAGSRTIGGAVAGTCSGPAVNVGHGTLAAQVLTMKLVSPTGGLLKIGDSQDSHLNVFRLSYGMLGIIYELTMRTRPISQFAVTSRRCSVKQFSCAIDSLVRTDVGIRFLFLPFRDLIYVDLRRFDAAARPSSGIPLKIREWGEHVMQPRLFAILNRLIPFPAIRYRLVDQLSQMTQQVLHLRLNPDSAIATTTSCTHGMARTTLSSTWFFPAADFSIVAQAYQDFCLRVKDESGFRCDLPSVGYRLDRDQSALLSPSHDEPMIALRAMSTPSMGWDNFAIDFGEFAQHWGASPAFDQTREIDAARAGEVFRERLELFRRVRRQVDSDQRMMNPFLSRYFL